MEKAERGKNAQLAYSFDIALQNEFSLDENITLARQFLLEHFVSRGMVVDFAIYVPNTEPGGISNPHFHVMAPIRPIEPNGNWGCKQHRVYELDEDGNRILDADGNYVFNAVPTTDWGSPETLEHWREQWAAMCNTKFEEKGLPERIDHRSYERQGIDLLPTVHEGPAARQMEAKGIRTDKGDFNRWIKATNALVQGVRKKITTQLEWLKDAKAELSKAQTPDLISLLQIYFDQHNAGAYSQKAIIADFVKTKFPGSNLTFFEDRGRSGYTFEQREGYQAMRSGLVSHKYDILIVKDFSRFSRRNSRGLVELEDLRDAGVRIISIGDNIDFPNDDDRLKIQFQFLINEMPVTDTSKKVKKVIRRRQLDGEWICAAPYGYIINKHKEFEIVPTEADIVRKIFDLYNNEGWGYKRIANYLTEQGIPTPRMCEQMRKEADDQPYNRKVNPAWAIVTVQGILNNDFYIGTLRQAK